MYVSQESTEGFQHIIVMNHYFYAIYACHMYTIYMLQYTIYRYDRPYRYNVHISHFYLIPLFRKALTYSRKKKKSQSDCRTIIKLYLMGERPLILAHLFSISTLLSHIYLYVHTYVCIHIYKHTHILYRVSHFIIEM